MRVHIFLISFLSLTAHFSTRAVKINTEVVDQLLTAPVKKLWPHAITFFATQTAVFTLPCWVWGGRSTGILMGATGIISSFCTLALLKKTEHSSVYNKIAAALAAPTLCGLYTWWDSDKWWAPPAVFLITTIPTCVAIAAVHYGCA